MTWRTCLRLLNESHILCYCWNLPKPKIYIFIYVLWNTNLLSSFSALFLTLPLFRQCFFLFLLFSVFFFNFVKPKLFYQYLFESLRKQQLRDIMLDMYVFNLITFIKLCSLLKTFFNTQQTFQRCLNIVARVIWRRDVGEYQINVEI